MKAHPGAPPGTKESPTRGGAETSELGRLKTENSTGTLLPLCPGWHIAMARAHAIQKCEGTAKIFAVRLWRIAVVAALGMRI